LNKRHRSLFISFEGIDRCGKSTQVARLEKRLCENDLKVSVFREPGSTAVSEQIRRILLSLETGEIEPRCELMLYSAARAQLVNEKIKPALEAGEVIIMDRFYHSTTAYQGYGRGLPINLIQSVNKLVTQGLKPDLTFILDISPENALLRRDDVGRDRLEKNSLEFFERVRQGYLKMAENDSHLIVLDGDQAVEKIEIQVWEKVSSLLRK
jgi:dTMP kinase